MTITTTYAVEAHGLTKSFGDTDALPDVDVDGIGDPSETLPDRILIYGHDGEAARRRNPQCVHRLTHEVLAQHRPQHGEAVTSSGERCAARALQVEIVPGSIGADHLAEEECPAVAEAR